ncbi:hypothetical protein FPRO04_12236 [Fusarium proliferatum]|nr:hypothetical protein FPRO04_12236 [Fusarium proliferatum]
MAASDITTIARLWETSGNAHTEIDEQIGSIIGSSQGLDSEFTNVRDQLYPLLLAKVATSQEGWLVADFLEQKDEILHDGNLFPCLKGPAIVGQFKVQSLSALQAIEKQTPQPLYALNFVPENVSNAIYNTAKGSFRPVDEALQQNSHGWSKNSRSDFYSLKLVSFGSRSKPQRGNQWQQWDDARSGNTDITDYTYMNAEMFMTRGPGPRFAANLLLAAASPALDRKNLDSGLYGDGVDWSFEEQNNCSACHSSARR